MPRSSKFRHLMERLHPSACGGTLRNCRHGRKTRTLSTRFKMHMVLRSSLARGAWSFSRRTNREMINRILAKHAATSGVQLLAIGNAGNHLHLKIKSPGRTQYKQFVRAITGEIALKIKRIPIKAPYHTSRLRPTDQSLADTLEERSKLRRGLSFWDLRPFTTIVSTLKYTERLVDYIKINNLEGSGFERSTARMIVQKWKDGVWREFG